MTQTAEDALRARIALLEARLETQQALLEAEARRRIALEQALEDAQEAASGRVRP